MALDGWCRYLLACAVDMGLGACFLLPCICVRGSVRVISVWEHLGWSYRSEGMGLDGSYRSEGLGLDGSYSSKTACEGDIGLRGDVCVVPV